MASRNAYKLTLFFPLSDNDGVEFQKEVWDWWFGEITRTFAGFTDLGTVNGWWLGHSDQNRWIVMVLKNEEEVGQIRDFLRTAKEKFRQKKMYLEYHRTYYEEVS
jgi:hypothetical protein